MIYLKNFFWPNKLLYFYGYNQIPTANWGQLIVIISLIIHVGLLSIAVLFRKKNKEISYGILFYFVSVFIYTHLLRTLADTMADRFLFVPSLGLIIAVVFLCSKLFNVDIETIDIDSVLKFKNTSNSKHKKFVLIFFTITVLLSITAFKRSKVWKDNETLISHDMPLLENCARAHNYYADILKTKLAKSFNPNEEAEMISHYYKSIQNSNESYYSYLGLGTYLCNAKKYEEGISVLTKMIKKFPNQADPNFYLGQAYYNTQNYSKSVFYLQKSLDLAPEVSNTYYFLALALSKTGESDKAITIIDKERQKFGESTFIFDALGNIYFDKGDLEQSTRNTFEMLKYGVNPEIVYGTVIGRYQKMKQDKPAAFYYQQAIQKGVFKK
jgi:tetratricopeptide (TPR) repeat protein